MKWIIAAIAVEATVEILVHSSLFAWLRRLGLPLFDCGWCLSVWVAGVVFGLIVIGLWWVMIPLAISRLSNVFHDVYGLLRR